jgi:hypothetical protein
VIAVNTCGVDGKRLKLSKEEVNGSGVQVCGEEAGILRLSIARDLFL